MKSRLRQTFRTKKYSVTRLTMMAKDAIKSAEDHQRSAIDSVKEAGDLLIKLKSRVKKIRDSDTGRLMYNWEDWVVGNIGISARSAQDYMQIAREWNKLAEEARKGNLSKDRALRILRGKEDNQPSPTPDTPEQPGIKLTGKQLRIREARRDLSRRINGFIGRCTDYEVLFLVEQDNMELLNRVFKKLCNEIKPIAPILVKAEEKRNNPTDHLLHADYEEDERYEEKQEYFKKIDLKILKHFKKRNDLTLYQRKQILKAVGGKRGCHGKRLLIEHLVSHESDSQRERIDQAA